MNPAIEFYLPDIGDFDAVEIIEVLVKEGEEIAAEQSVITLESDKASMEIPAPYAGVVDKLAVKIGDQVKAGDLIMTLISAESDIKADIDQKTNAEKQVKTTRATTDQQPSIMRVPDIGDFESVEVIEILVKVGDQITAEQSIITLESDKASMEIPSSHSGIVSHIGVSIGDKVSQGDEILTLMITDTASQSAKDTSSANIAAQSLTAERASVSARDADIQAAPIDAPSSDSAGRLESQRKPADPKPEPIYHSSPAVRKLARELGVALKYITGTGAKGRILASDVKAYVKQRLQSGGTAAIPQIPEIDFSEFGDITLESLSRINKLSSKHLHACWLNVAHVTQFDEADITELEQFRQEQKAKGVRLTPIVFVIKAIAHLLTKYPRFNASLSQDGESLIIKKYINIGVAVNTPDGLVVPVIRSVTAKSLTALATELEDLATRARQNKLKLDELKGGSFTISSLGSIGGTQFTPIVNAPEVAILGVSRHRYQPVWDGEQFTPRLMLPLALSYDHRVIDGVLGVEFITELCASLVDFRSILL